MDRTAQMKVPVSILVPTKNEVCNLPRCLSAVKDWADEIVVVDSQSTDGTVECARSAGASVLTFAYDGGWPKKRQWALDTYSFRNKWILLLDADEILPEALKNEIEQAIGAPDYDGYRLRFEIVFFGRQLKHGATGLHKLSLFRRGKGRFEKRLENQSTSMCDMEVHEHVIVQGRVGTLRNAVRHENLHSLDRYIEKHNAYSNWAAKVFLDGDDSGVKPDLFGTQAARRRWLVRTFMSWPFSPLAHFLFLYVMRLGFLDGKPGFLYCVFQAIQMFHVKAKIYEQTIDNATV